MRFYNAAIEQSLAAVKVQCKDGTTYMLFYNSVPGCWHSLTDDGAGDSEYINSLDELEHDEIIVQRWYIGDSVYITF
jgi:hypothetical protein